MNTRTSPSTKGPWKVYEVEEEGRIIARGIQQVEGKGLNKGLEYELFSKADATLIAAAPTLYTTVQDLLDLIDRWYSIAAMVSVVTGDNSILSMELESTMEDARKLLTTISMEDK